MGEVIKYPIYAFVFVILLLLTTTGREAVQLSEPQNYSSFSAQEVKVPRGYEFADAYAYGKYEENLVYIFKETKTGKIFKASGDRVGDEIVLPQGYTFMSASAYGSYAATVSYYVMNDSDGRIYKVPEADHIPKPTESYWTPLVKVPAGYEFVDAFAYGRFEENPVYVFREIKTGKIFKSGNSEDEIGNEITVPRGYTFLGASAYGRYEANVAYYIMNDTDKRVYKVEP